MRTLLTAVALVSMLGLTACQNTGHKSHEGHDHAAGETCCTTDAKAQCTTCTAVGKDTCTTCKK